MSSKNHPHQTPTDRLRATSRALQRALLGAILTSSGDCLVDLLAEGLSEEHFTTPEYRSWFALLLSRHDDNEPISQRIAENLALMSERPARFGPAALPAECVLWSSGDPIHDAKELIALSLLEALQDHGRRCQAVCSQGVPDGRASAYVEALLEEVVADVTRLDSAPSSGEESAEDMADSLEAALLASQDPATRPAPISTGLRSLDDLFRPEGSLEPAGLIQSELIVLGARPGAGKTATAENLALNLAEDGHGIAFASCDMSPGQLRGRFLAKICRRLALSRSQSSSPRVGQLISAAAMSGLTADHRDLAVEASRHLRPLPINVERLYNPTIRALRTYARQCKRRFDRQETPLRLFVVDYLDKVKGNRDDGDRRLQIGAICNALKDLAEELDCTVLLLVQMNREADRNPRGKPTKGNLKESGDIEQAADIIWLLWKQSNYDPTSAQDEITLLQEKNRRDREGRAVTLSWHGESGTLSDPPHPESPAGNLRRLRQRSEWMR